MLIIVLNYLMDNLWYSGKLKDGGGITHENMLCIKKSSFLPFLNSNQSEGRIFNFGLIFTHSHDFHDDIKFKFKAKIIEVRTNRARPSWPCLKNCPNVTF